MDRDEALDAGIRVGLVSYGVVHLLVAWLGLQLALGDRGRTVSGSGAFRQLADTEVGRVSLYVVVVGLVALMVWQGLEAVAGHRGEPGGKRPFKRLASAGKVAVYGVLAWTALQIALGGSDSRSTESYTAQLMRLPLGVVLVALVGLGILTVAGGLAYLGWQEKFLTHLDIGGRIGNEGRVHRWFGKAGYLSKAVAFAIVGGLFLYAAWTHDPDKSGGLDQALLKVLHQPYGPFLLGVIAIGVACYGLFCFAWARHLDR